MSALACMLVLALTDRAIGFFAEKDRCAMPVTAAAETMQPPAATTFRARCLAASADVMPRIIVTAVFRPPLIRAAARRAIRADDVCADITSDEFVAFLPAVIAESAILCILDELSF